MPSLSATRGAAQHNQIVAQPTETVPCNRREGMGVREAV